MISQAFASEIAPRVRVKDKVISNNITCTLTLDNAHRGGAEPRGTYLMLVPVSLMIITCYVLRVRQHK